MTQNSTITAPASFFIYLIDRGVSIEDYKREMDTVHTADMDYSQYRAHRHARYALSWPDEWAAYCAWCKIMNFWPH